MSDNLNLANIQKNKEKKEFEELSRRMMTNVIGNGGTPEEEMEKECCLMFCQVTNDSTGELLFFIL